MKSSLSFEFFFVSAIIEHTNQVIFMEDDDLAVIRNGALTIHRAQHEVSGQSTIREIIELKIELQEIMKGIELKQRSSNVISLRNLHS